MHLQQPVQLILLPLRHRIQLHMPRIQPALQLPVFIQHPGHAARHSRGEVVPHRSKHSHPAACHVFAAVVAHAFHNRPGAGIAHGEAFPGHAGHKGVSARRAVQGHVADQGILRLPHGVHRRAHRQHAAGKSLAQIVVRHAVERDLLPPRQESAEGLSTAALGLNLLVSFQHRPESPVRGHQVNMVLIQPDVRPLRQAEIMLRGRLEAGVPGKPGQV